MKTAIAQQLLTSFRFTLTVKSGPDAGKSFQLLPPKVTLGRDPSSDIVLSDPKVSRQQATVEFREDKVVVIDQSSRGTVSVNGTKADFAPLENGDKISFGQTEIVFRMDTVALPQVFSPPQMTTVQNSPFPSAIDYQMGGAAESKPQKPSRRRNDDSGKVVFYAIIGVLVLGGAYFYNEDQTQQETTVTVDRSLRSAEKVEAEIAESERLQETLFKEKGFKSEADRRRYEDAQSHYVQGFRDLQKSSYSRAIKAFETALAIDPSHVMARRYYKQASRSRDEFVVQHILEARQYKQRQMYPRCVSSIDKALGVMGEVTEGDLKSKEAMSLRKECEALTKERF